jgi:XRE family aerobic/anaerobic benzoate catabolism transcriptional regulator
MDEPESVYLHRLGERLRLARTRRGMTIRALARQSGVSARFIAQTEGGTGNLSVLRLRDLAAALGVAPADLLADRGEALMRAEAVLAGLGPVQQAEAADVLARHFAAGPVAGRERRIALIGLRGAGKSTLGRRLAAARGMLFVELDHEIERLAGVGLAEIFELHGQVGFRRLEQQALDGVVAGGTGAVIAAGGSIVATPATYERLLRTCRTIWVRATPEEHMRRVVAQGDMRPMADNANAMDDLRAILASRVPLYARAELVLDTSGRDVAESLAELERLLG